MLLIFLLLTGAAAYAALIWYPDRAAADLMRPLSSDFATSASPLSSAIASFPEGNGTESLAASADVLAATDEARRALVNAQIDLEEQSTVSVPILSSREPLDLANDTRERLEAFYPLALELVGDLEAAARYLTNLMPVLPNLDNLRAALRGPGSVEQMVAAARPIAEQLLADVRTLSPPAELSTVQASLLAISRGIGGSIDEMERVGQTGATRVVRALREDIRSQVDSFAQAASEAPSEALAGGLADQIAEAERRIERITAALRALADQGVNGITLP